MNKLCIFVFSFMISLSICAAAGGPISDGSFIGGDSSISPIYSDISLDEIFKLDIDKNLNNISTDKKVKIIDVKNKI